MGKPTVGSIKNGAWDKLAQRLRPVGLSMRLHQGDGMQVLAASTLIPPYDCVLRAFAIHDPDPFIARDLSVSLNPVCHTPGWDSGANATRPTLRLRGMGVEQHEHGQDQVVLCGHSDRL